MNAEEIARVEESHLLGRGAWLAELVEHHPEELEETFGIPPTTWWIAMLSEAFRQGPRAHVDDHLLNATDWSDLLPQVHAAVRVWHGANDDNIRLNSVRWMVERLPYAQLSVVPGAGHDIGNRWPEILAWLADHSRHD